MSLVSGAPQAPLALPARGAGVSPSRGRLAVLGLVLAAALILVLLDATGVVGSAPAAAAPDVPGRPASSAAAPAEAGPRRATATPGAAAPGTVSSRVVAPRHAQALFAQRSWYVAPKPPPPAPPPPPPAPTAPPLPFTFLGSYAPQGTRPVFFLGRGDRVVEARVGEVLDGVYRFVSADGAQLVFDYLPLETRQTLATGGTR